MKKNLKVSTAIATLMSKRQHDTVKSNSWATAPSYWLGTFDSIKLYDKTELGCDHTYSTPTTCREAGYTWEGSGLNCCIGKKYTEYMDVYMYTSNGRAGFFTDEFKFEKLPKDFNYTYDTLGVRPLVDIDELEILQQIEPTTSTMTSLMTLSDEITDTVLSS